MTRKIKQFLFAVLFFVLFFLIIGGFFFLLYTLPSIIAERQAPPEIEEEDVILPVEIRENTSRFLSWENSRASFFVHVHNPNIDKYADVLYEVLFINSEGGVGDVKRNRLFILPGERSMIHEGANVPGNNIVRADINILETRWSDDGADESLTFPEVESFNVSVSGREMVVSGVVVNPEVTRWAEVKVVATFVDQIGSPVFSAHVVLEDMDVVESRSFKILIPDSANLYSAINPGNTRMLVTVYGNY